MCLQFRVKMWNYYVWVRSCNYENATRVRTNGSTGFMNIRSSVTRPFNCSKHVFASTYCRFKAAKSSFETFNEIDRKSTRLNSSHVKISYAVFCLKKKKKK